jgi:hypothetical protein
MSGPAVAQREPGRPSRMPEPIDTIRRVNSDEVMTVPELRRAAATLDRYARTGKSDVLQTRLRVNKLLEDAGAPLVPAPGDVTRALSRARVTK